MSSSIIVSVARHGAIHGTVHGTFHWKVLHLWIGALGFVMEVVIDDCEDLLADTLSSELELDERVRKIIVLPNERRTITQSGRTMGSSLVHMVYVNRAMEWVNLKRAIKE